jgi:hypothetical protein
MEKSGRTFLFELCGICGWLLGWRQSRTDGESCGDSLGGRAGAAGIAGAVDGFGYKYQQYGRDVAGERSGGRQQRDGDDLCHGTLHSADYDPEPEYGDD